MIWLTWRRHRGAAAVAAFVFAGASVAVIMLGVAARSVARQVGAAGCDNDCGDALERLHQHYHWLPPVTGLLLALPLLAGMFWAGPLIAREYEAGTHRLVWTQSITRLRWISVKVAVIFGVVTAAALVLGLEVYWALTPLAPAFGSRFNSTWFDIQALVPAACMLFALSAGVLLSALTRRTLASMALTLLVYVAARTPMHWVRMHFAPSREHAALVPLARLLDDPTAGALQSVPAQVPASDWALSTVATDPSGGVVRGSVGNLDLLLRYCPHLPVRSPIDAASRRECLPKLDGLSLRGVVRYQPAGHFWQIQAVESAIFAVVAGLLIAATLFVVARRQVG